MDTETGESYSSIVLPSLMSMSDNVGVVNTWVTALSGTHDVGDTLQFEYQETPSYNVVYHAADHASNEVNCLITVTVRGEY